MTNPFPKWSGYFLCLKVKEFSKPLPIDEKGSIAPTTRKKGKSNKEEDNDSDKGAENMDKPEPEQGRRH
jgi:hypothetical protein